jgi:hypothetical protein
MTSGVSFHALQRSLSVQERRRLGGLDDGRDLLAELDRLLDQGEEKAEAVSEAMAYELVYRTMMESMFDRRRGAVPRFVGRLKRVVDSLEASVR